MKLLTKIFIAGVCAMATVLPSVAQQSSSSSTIMRKRTVDDDSADKATGVTERMKTIYEESEVSPANLSWMRVIYRSLDLTQEANLPLYYPDMPTDGEECLYRIIMRLLADNQIKAYEYLDGRELFTETYQIDVKEMLERFHILYTEAKGSSAKNPKYTIDESDVPTNEVLSYYIMERWEFDKVSSRMKAKVTAICPVLHRSGDFGGEAIKYPMFWVQLKDIRPYMAQQLIFASDDNNVAQYSYDDYFQLGMYDGEIYKTKNLRNLSLMQLYPDSTSLKNAQDSIENRLLTYDDSIWVPSREELLAIAANDTTQVTKKEKKSSVKRSSRSSNSSSDDSSSSSVAKSSSISSSSSTTAVTRSVRNRK
ncbi:MAG: gliding motility protein GldN [Bacteroidales bacterium]